MSYLRLGTQAARNVAKRIAKKSRGLATGPVRKPKNTKGIVKPKATRKAKTSYGKLAAAAGKGLGTVSTSKSGLAKLKAKAKKAPIKTKTSRKKNR